MTPLFRPAVMAERQALAELINSAYRGDSSRAGWTTEADLLDGQRTDAEDLGSLLGRTDSHILAAFEAVGGDSGGANAGGLKTGTQKEGRLIGCVHLESRAPGRCYLGMFTVSPKLQGAGLGRAMMAEAEAFARYVYGSHTMEMTVITARTELIAWYERRGYRRTGKIMPFPVHPKFGAVRSGKLEMEYLEKGL
jgi:ribosomal protein S18 acetylase RimI-like enzyme